MFTEIESQVQEHPETPEALIENELIKLQDGSMIIPQLKENEFEVNINSIRHKFGLNTIETAAETLSNLLDDANITGALEIKLENEIGEFEVNDEAVSEQDDESSEEEDDDSEIEQLSDSQLKKYEESLHFQDESSESEHEAEPKKPRRKYRKSDDEKLFE